MINLFESVIKDILGNNIKNVYVAALDTFEGGTINYGGIILRIYKKDNSPFTVIVKSDTKNKTRIIMQIEHMINDRFYVYQYQILKSEIVSKNAEYEMFISFITAIEDFTGHTLTDYDKSGILERVEVNTK